MPVIDERAAQKPTLWEWRVYEGDTPLMAGFANSRETAQIDGDSASVPPALRGLAITRRTGDFFTNVSMCEVSFAPINGHRKRDAACPKSANSGKDWTCIGDKRAIMCADCAYALPDDHEPRNIATDKHAQSVR